MTPYLNLQGDSGIAAYGIGPDHIRIKFIDTAKVYRYSYRKAGIEHVENMKKLAMCGKGLNTYLNRYVRDLYD